MDDVVGEVLEQHEAYGGESPVQEYEDGYEGADHPHSFGFPKPGETETDPRVISQTQYGNDYAEGPEMNPDPAKVMEFFFGEEDPLEDSGEEVTDGGREYGIPVGGCPNRLNPGENYEGNMGKFPE